MMVDQHYSVAGNSSSLTVNMDKPFNIWAYIAVTLVFALVLLWGFPVIHESKQRMGQQN